MMECIAIKVTKQLYLQILDFELLDFIEQNLTNFF